MDERSRASPSARRASLLENEREPGSDAARSLFEEDRHRHPLERGFPETKVRMLVKTASVRNKSLTPETTKLGAARGSWALPQRSTAPTGAPKSC